MTKIERFDQNERLSRIVVYNSTVYLSGLTADDKKTDTSAQTKQILEKADTLLERAGTDRSKLLFAKGSSCALPRRQAICNPSASLF